MLFSAENASSNAFRELRRPKWTDRHLRHDSIHATCSLVLEETLEDAQSLNRILHELLREHDRTKESRVELRALVSHEALGDPEFGAAMGEFRIEAQIPLPGKFSGYDFVFIARNQRERRSVRETIERQNRMLREVIRAPRLSRADLAEMGTQSGAARELKILLPDGREFHARELGDTSVSAVLSQIWKARREGIDLVYSEARSAIRAPHEVFHSVGMDYQGTLEKGRSFQTYEDIAIWSLAIG